MPAYTNSQGEKISIRVATSDEFVGQAILVIHDDPSPLGSGVGAPMLLDEGTREWLKSQLAEMDKDRSS